jgi:PAS domain-containing protein
VANSPYSQPVGAPGSSTRGAAAAVLVLDANGKILLADAGARALWRMGEAELSGAPFSSLFAFEVTSQDPGWLESQWEVLVASTAAGPLRLEAQPGDGARMEVSVRLEKSTFAAAPGYLAFVQPVNTTAADKDLLTMLADHSPVGIFDLNFRAGTFDYSPAWKRQLGYARSRCHEAFPRNQGLFRRIPPASQEWPLRPAARNRTPGVRIGGRD